MTMNRSEVRRWIEGFEAAASVDRKALRGQSPDSSWSIRLSLSLIAAAGRAGWQPAARDRVRDADAEAVRETWAVIRRRLGR